MIMSWTVLYDIDNTQHNKHTIEWSDGSEVSTQCQARNDHDKCTSGGKRFYFI